MAPAFTQKLQMWLEPAMILAVAIYSHFLSTLHLVFHSPSRISPSTLKAEGFARFWLTISPPAQPNDSRQAMPGPFAPLPSLLASASGRVAELGPGSGSLMRYFNAAKITEVYGIEPAERLHPAIRQSAEAIGLGDRYRILGCGAEPEQLIPALAKAGLLTEGSTEALFDTIISIRSLCSVSRPEETVKEMYRMLKPEGKMIVCEHVVNSWKREGGSVVGRVMQTVYHMLGWRYFLGDCNLDRDSVGLIRAAANEDGGWEKVDIKSEAEYGAMPWVTGVFVKKVA